MNKKSLLYTSLNSMIVFHEVAKYQSFSKAAEELFISQPAVTKHIRELEKKVGMGLIQRRRREFSLTDAGKILFKYTRKISTNLMEVESLLENLKKDYQGILRIGTTESYSKSLMPKLLSDFQTSFPLMKISLEVGNSEEIEKSLLAYKNDLVLIAVTKASSRFESIPFLKEELVLIVSPDHPLVGKKTISLIELEKYPLIIRAKGSTTRKIILQAFKEAGIHPSLLIEAGSSEFIKQWVSEGKGISIIVKSTVEDEEKRGIIKVIPLLEKLYLKVAFLYLKEERSHPTIQAFIKFIESQRGKLLKSVQ